MPLQDKSIGADLSFQINTPDGILAITPDLVGSYTADPMSDWKEWLPITGIQEFTPMPGCWGGSIELIRKSNIVERFWAIFEAAYYAGVTIQASTMLETIKESDGSITQWNYLNTMFRFTKAGDWRGNEYVMQSLEWRASRRILI